MRFCIRDDDTSFFTRPDDLENCYAALWAGGPVSLAVVPFHKGCRSKGIPEAYHATGDTYPLGDNHELVKYLREQVSAGRVEIMLHGITHADHNGTPEFASDTDLSSAVIEAKVYLEQLLDCQVSVFVPPHNRISRAGLKAVTAAGLHLGCMAAPRLAWNRRHWRTWYELLRFRMWLAATGHKPIWPLKLGDHREIAGHAVTPSADHDKNVAALQLARRFNGVFCLATHYWEFDVPHRQ
ncbi:MAG: DUF2334 domain-containing protein, partial [Anaerolineae bacterium]|nr:DUF2334 domain-containing protein [Anaerolineae bacterium]